MMVRWILPLRTVSEANSSEHWSKKARRHRMQHYFVRLSYNKNVPCMHLPCKATLTRLAPRQLDTDNLLTSMKYIRDELSECILGIEKKIYRTAKGKFKSICGHNDSDPRISWHYDQRKSKTYGIEITLEFQNGHSTTSKSTSSDS
jgi:hypothetical protein